MREIIIYFKDQTVKQWRHEGRAGGSYTKEVTYKDGWVIVRDEWGNTTAFPSETVEFVETKE
jgi:hypothetical protein